MSNTPIELVLSKLADAKRAGKGWSARCPAHEDRRASLSVVQGDNGGVVLHCHAGCEPAAVVTAIGLKLADLMPERVEPTGSKKKPSGGWNWSVKGVRVVPYRLPELTAEPTGAVVVTEGERDADNLAGIGVLATCNAGGAGKWTAEHAEFLWGRHVIVLPDNDDARHNHAQQVAQSLQGIAESVLPWLVVHDATSEKLGIMLGEQRGRIASVSPEGGLFDLMAALYSKSGIPQFGVYLMGHSGDDLITDRVSRKSVRVERPALTCAYAMQPQVIKGLAENVAFRGRGLLARFLYAAPESWIGRREIAPPPVSEATREAYRRTVWHMAADCGNSGSDSEPTLLRLTADARRELEAWESEIEAMLGDGGQMEMTRDWGAKLAGATLRLAAVFHCVEDGAAEQTHSATIRRAVEVAQYLAPHAEAVLRMMQADEGSEDANAQYVLRWIVRHSKQEFTKTEAQHHGKRRFPKADDIDPALAELERRGYIRSRPVKAAGRGRPPSPAYDVNPAVFAEPSTEKRSHYSRNPVGQAPAGGSQLSCGNTGSALGQSENANREQMTI